MKLKIALTLSVLLLGGCRVDRRLEPPPLETSVRCDIKAYNIDNLCEDEKRYLDQAIGFDKNINFRQLDRKILGDLTQQTSDVDVAAALFYQRGLIDSKNKKLLEFVAKRSSLYQKKLPDFSRNQLLFLMVPGMFYRDNYEVEASGSSLRELARKMGLKDDLIPTTKLPRVVAHPLLQVATIKPDVTPLANQQATKNPHQRRLP